VTGMQAASQLVAASWAGLSSTSGGTTGWVVVGLCGLATIFAGIRWLRVAQREHYLPGSVTRFALRWWVSRPSSIVLGIGALACVGLAWQWPFAALGTAVAGAIGPIGLRLRARTSALDWTARLKRLAVAFAVLQAAIVAVVGVILRAPFAAAIGVLVSPRILDLACAVASPIEKRMVRPYVEQAKARLARVKPRVVAVTGSYGKTSTKQAISHILSGSVSTVASPASYNNRAGLARAVNEHLADGTEVFVAEMGTYGPGEIAELCEWLDPEVSVITAVGPVHLERFGSEDRVLQAKAEIVANCRVAVLATDDPRLAQLADRLIEQGRSVVRCSTLRAGAEDEGGAAEEVGGKIGRDVVVERTDGPNGTLRVKIGGRVVKDGIQSSARESNLACALGVVVALGLPVEAAVARLEGIPSTAHRLESVKGSGGAIVLDDTYNSNPKGAAVALSLLADLGANSERRVVVTPGMVELGRLQQRENAALGRSVAAVATDLVVVGRTNRRALVEGAREAYGDRPESRGLSVIEVSTREDAVSWVRANVGHGDVVLYENDLPDHYP
jgi:UDP-N-acetylmuramoyl-tripeptide--D-alanyl-D-alanine ligase